MSLSTVSVHILIDSTDDLLGLASFLTAFTTSIMVYLSLKSYKRIMGNAT